MENLRQAWSFYKQGEMWAGREPKGVLGMPGGKQEAITIGYMGLLELVIA